MLILGLITEELLEYEGRSQGKGIKLQRPHGMDSFVNEISPRLLILSNKALGFKDQSLEQTH